MSLVTDVVNEVIEIAKVRLVAIVFIILVSLLAGFYGRAYVTEFTTTIIVTIFSIFAGFLVALMVLLAEPPKRAVSKGVAFFRAREFKYRLIRKQIIFYGYLSTMMVVLAASVLRQPFPVMAEWLDFLFLSSATCFLLLSFTLPSSLLKLQLERHNFISNELDK